MPKYYPINEEAAKRADVYKRQVWQDAGNLSADQTGPHPRCYAFQPLSLIHI